MNDGIRNTVYGFLAYVRAQDGRPYAPACPDEVRLCRIAYDQGYLNICPPGERYRLNAAGLHWLDSEPEFLPMPAPYGWDGWPSEGGKWIGIDEYLRREAAERARVDAIGGGNG